MKKISSLLILMFIVFSFLLSFFSFKSCAMEKDLQAEVEIQEKIDEETKKEIDIKELSILHMNREMELIEHLKEKDKLKWYKTYRSIICKYRNVIDQPLTIFDIYTEEEVRLICRTVETECYEQSFEAKCNVASVIINRIEDQDKRFGDSVKEVITKPNQFAYWRKIIQEDTLWAVMFSFEIEDTTNNCIAFRSGYKPEKWYTTETNYWEKQFVDDSGHGFYK